MIKLTLDKDPEGIFFVNPSYLTALYRSSTATNTEICSVGESETFWNVKETPEEIVKLIKEATS